MVQKKYLFDSFEELTQTIDEICGSQHYNDASGVLLQMYNPKIDAEEERIVEYINEKCHKACLIGLTCADIADAEYDISDNPIELNVTYFFKTKLYELDFDMDHATGFEAGRTINEQLLSIPGAKCIEVCYSCSSARINSFIHEFGHHTLPMFGAKAGRNIRALNAAKVYGTKARENGIVAVVFESDSLHVYMDNCMGFQEIGIAMQVTQTEGDNIIKTINHHPATDMYTKYLKVKPNRHFVENVCEFPLIFDRNGCNVARVPASYGEDGSIIFTSDVRKGDTFRLSYGNADKLFAVVNRSISGLRQFNPEAVFLFECGNRIRFLKDQAYREIVGYLGYAPDTSVAIGYAELFITPNGGGGAMNSSLVAVGLTEDSSSDNAINACVKAEEDVLSSYDGRGHIPFIDRVLNFLETTSMELNEVNKELGRIAYTDRLTKIFNRWELEHKITDNLLMAQDDSYKLCLIFMDIDHFKRVNDTYGHDAGDMVLRTVVSEIKENLEQGHVFGRWGGEEFIYILPNTPLDDARNFAEKLRKQIEESSFGQVGHITMSFGVTEAHRDDDMDSFVKRADEALYEAKETGRNKVVIKK